MNRRGFQYIVGEDANGNETITIFQPEMLIDKKDADGVATVHHPDKVQDETLRESGEFLSVRIFYQD